MAVRTRRVKLLEGMCRTISDRLHERVGMAALDRGLERPPESTRAIYLMAAKVVPGLLEQLLGVYRMLSLERTPGRGLSAAPPVDDRDRERMLSAVRAAVGRTRLGGRAA